MSKGCYGDDRGTKEEESSRKRTTKDMLPGNPLNAWLRALMRSESGDERIGQRRCAPLWSSCRASSLPTNPVTPVSRTVAPLIS